jgi:hypothetical protein
MMSHDDIEATYQMLGIATEAERQSFVQLAHLSQQPLQHLRATSNHRTILSKDVLDEEEGAALAELERDS